MLLNITFDLNLQPVSYLSLALQKEDIDPVKTIEILLSIRKWLQKLKCSLEVSGTSPSEASEANLVKLAKNNGLQLIRADVLIQ